MPVKSRIERLERSFPPAPELSLDDCDALTIYQHLWLDADMAPSDRDLAATSIYGRGRELSERMASAEHCEFAAKSSAASTFAFLFGRLPRAGDVMRFSQLEYVPVITRHLQREFIEAWGRQLPELPCPLRFDGDRLQKRTRPPTKGHTKGLETWVDHRDFAHDIPESDWIEIEREAVSDHVSLAPSIAGVVFIDAVRCRPATEREIKEDQTEASGGLLGVVVKALRRLKEEGVVA
jgi:hypothetical protein